MIVKLPNKYKLTIICISLWITALPEANAQQPCEQLAGKFVSIEGKIEFEHPGTKGRQSAALEASLCQNDIVYVGTNSRAAITLVNEAVLRLDQNTTMQLVDVAAEPQKRSLLQLIMGSFKSFSRPPRTFAVNTPYLNGLIEGTEFAMRVDGDSALTTVYEGKVTTTNPQGKLTLQRGESALAKAGQAPQSYQMIKPRDAVQWTLYYPSLFSLTTSNSQKTLEQPAALKTAFALQAAGNVPAALEQLEQITAAQQDTDYHVYRAALFLDVGRANEARTEIALALSKDPNAGLAYALRAIIGLVANERDPARADAEKAVSLTSAAAAKIALSYVQQADFQLDAARNTLLTVATEHPEEALAWARLGELWLMSGDREKAMAAANKAKELAPNLARVQTVFGFTSLAESREADARLAFEKAISLSSDDPLAHFGLGLAKIKRGDLPEGRSEIEAAVALDSNNALLRSYLGKAYYEEKRMPLDSQQYAIAEELDPKDPTPYFYDAIDKQTSNRPVEAMQALDKAIELNDNRAIYRSRQLLDSDVASRSASMGRIYSDLGFQELALRQGWKSINADPSNFSAHRFLADSYSVLPRNEISRVSELLQSQLLQPLNMTPIQPHLAESNLFLIGAGGPGGVSFNEFNPIFNRDGLTFQTNGYAGSHNTFSGEQVVSGIYDKAAFSMGYSQFKSDGWRSNAYQDDAIGNAFLQLELSPNTTVQTEYRYRNSKTGDLDLRFLQDNLIQTTDKKEETNLFRVGLRHAFAENSTMLASFIYQQRDHKQIINFNDPNNFLNQINNQFPNQQTYSGELQHLFKSDLVNVTTGIGYSDVNAKQHSQIYNNLFGMTPDVYTAIFGFAPQSLTISPENTKHLNMYAYTYINALKNVTFNLGGSGDFYQTDSSFTSPRNQFNPKFGMTWNILPSTTFRAAAFRVLKRPLVSNQTLEPTQIAGFNQFYDDFNSTDSWRFGGAFDHIFSPTLFGGIEFSERLLNIPFQYTDPNTQLTQLQRDNSTEYLGRSYLYWTPKTWLALNAGYQHEVFHNLTGVAFDYRDLNTDRYAMGFKVFDKTGFSASVQATNFNQNGNFVPYGGNACCTTYGASNFWILDTSVAYRLPKRYGLIRVGANNLLNEKFNYTDTNRGVSNNNPLIMPDRVVYGSVTLAFP